MSQILGLVLHLHGHHWVSSGHWLGLQILGSLLLLGSIPRELRMYSPEVPPVNCVTVGWGQRPHTTYTANQTRTSIHTTRAHPFRLSTLPCQSWKPQSKGGSHLCIVDKGVNIAGRCMSLIVRVLSPSMSVDPKVYDSRFNLVNCSTSCNNT